MPRLKDVKLEIKAQSSIGLSPTENEVTPKLLNSSIWNKAYNI